MVYDVDVNGRYSDLSLTVKKQGTILPLDSYEYPMFFIFLWYVYGTHILNSAWGHQID